MFNQNNRTDKLKVITQIVIAISFVVGICVFIGIKSVQKSRINTSVTTETTAESVAENTEVTLAKTDLISRKDSLNLWSDDAKAKKMKDLCEEHGWVAISMKDDWSTIYRDGVTR